MDNLESETDLFYRLRDQRIDKNKASQITARTLLKGRDKRPK